jgi:soluble cytochrome b562
LKRQVADPKQNQASLAAVAKMRKACVEGSQYLPAKIATLPAKDQAAAKSSYQDRMKDLLDSIDELAAALKANNNKEALKVIEDLTFQEDAGHKEFRPKKKNEE